MKNPQTRIVGFVAFMATVAVVVALTGCGGDSPAAPTAGGSIEVTWRGTITYTKPAPMTVQTTWIFKPLAANKVTSIPLTVNTSTLHTNRGQTGWLVMNE